MAEITVETTDPLPDSFVPDKTVVIIEGIDGETGETTVWWTCSPGVKGWQSLGMLEAAVEVEKSYLVQAFQEDDRD